MAETFKMKFNEELRYDYPLNMDSVVWDIGGYKGDFAHEINKRHECNVHIFEPIPEFYDNIKKRFINNINVYVNRFGLSNTNRAEYISINKDSSSLTRGYRSELVTVFDIKEAMRGRVDLMKINIEGEEYNLLKRLLECDLAKNINYLQIQFHSWYKDAEKLRSEIQKELSKTHELSWNYDFIWESWKNKDYANS